MPMSGSTYVLEGRDSELSQHNGHQVEVTGTLASASSTGSSSGASTTGSSSGATTTSGAAGTSTSSPSASSSGSSASAQHINVTSVRMIASTCSAQ